MNCLAENSDVKANSPWVFLFFIHSLFHTEFCRCDVRCNNISVSISSPESDSEFRAMNSAIAHFVGLQETTSIIIIIIIIILNMPSHSVTQCFPRCVSLPCSACVSICPHTVAQCFPRCVSLPCSACVSICPHTVSRSVSRPASPCPALPASQYALTLSRSFPRCVSLPCVTMCARPKSGPGEGHGTALVNVVMNLRVP